MKQSTTFATTLLAFSGLSSSSPIANIAPADVVDFNTLLDGSLGNMPALFLVSQGALLEMNADASPQQAALAQGFVAAATASAPASTLAAGIPRIGKEDGFVLGAFISSMLIPAAVNLADSTLAGGVCKSLVAGAGGMVGAVVGQEAARTLYPNGSTEALELEQTIVPGTFTGGIAGSSVGTALSKTLCTKLVPDLEKAFKNMNPDAMTKLSRVLDRGLTEILTAQLKELGVDPVKALTFAHQMGETLRLADQFGLPNAFDYLNQELISNTANLAKVASKGLKTTPAIDSLVKIGLQNIFVECSLVRTAISSRTRTNDRAPGVTGQYKQILDLAKSVPGAKQAATRLSGATKRLHSAVMDAAGLVKNGSLDSARKMLDDEARGDSEIRHDNPQVGGGKAEVKVLYTTKTKTTIKTLVRTLTPARKTKHLTSMHIVTATANVTHTLPPVRQTHNVTSTHMVTATTIQVHGICMSGKLPASTGAVKASSSRLFFACALCRGLYPGECSKLVSRTSRKDWDGKVRDKCTMCTGMSPQECAVLIKNTEA